MIIAIVGSRYVSERDIIDKLDILTFNGFFRGVDSFVSGGARGVDRIAQTYLENKGYYVEVIRPIHENSKEDYLYRNVEIVTKCDKLLAFWDGTSPGTGFIINYAKHRNKPLHIVEVVKK